MEDNKSPVPSKAHGSEKLADGERLYELTSCTSRMIKAVTEGLIAPTINATGIWLSINYRFITAAMAASCLYGTWDSKAGLLLKLLGTVFYTSVFLVLDHLIANPSSTKKGRDALRGQINDMLTHGAARRRHQRQDEE